MKNNKIWLNKNVGSYLREVRKSAGLSQNDAASALGYSSNQFISNLERGVCSVSPTIIRKLLTTYGVNEGKVIEDLLDLQLKFLSAEFKGKCIPFKKLG